MKKATKTTAKKAAVKKATASDSIASQQITNMIEELDDWRGKLIARLRNLISTASPNLTEEWKWSTAVWSHKGMVCAVGAFKDHVKVNFFKGASLDDSFGMFNAGLDAKATRAIDIHDGDSINEVALKALIRSAVAFNLEIETKK